MRLIKEMTQVKDRVKALLIRYPHLRNSDNKLIATIWKFDLVSTKMHPDNMSGTDLLLYYADEKLTNAETIRRVRQKIQEENPELRGAVNDLRKEQAEDVRKNI
jgi:hypothetical protein